MEGNYYGGTQGSLFFYKKDVEVARPQIQILLWTNKRIYEFGETGKRPKKIASRIFTSDANNWLPLALCCFALKYSWRTELADESRNIGFMPVLEGFWDKAQLLWFGLQSQESHVAKQRMEQGCKLRVMTLCQKRNPQMCSSLMSQRKTWAGRTFVVV